jgi:hypothetical protein
MRSLIKQRPFQALVAGILACIIALVTMAPTAIIPGHSTAASADPGSPSNPLVGNDNDGAQYPKVLSEVTSWTVLVALVDAPGNSYQWYRDCFSSQTGHAWAEAQNAAKLEKEGWNLQVTLVSNASVATIDEKLNARGEKRDEDIVSVSGFENTRGVDANHCEPFQDSRSQARLALTLPGKDKTTAGEPVVLEHCGNVLPKPKSPPPPASTVPQPPPTTTKAPTTTVKPPTTPPTTPPTVPPTTPPTVPPTTPPTTPPTVPPTTPPTTPPTVPPTTRPTVPPTVPPTTTPKCTNTTGTCGTPTSGPEQQPPQSNPGQNTGGTPGYTPTAPTTTVKPTSTTTPTTPTPNGTDSGSPTGAPGGTTTKTSGGTTTTTPGTSAGTSKPAPTEGSGQTSSGDPGGPP